MGDTFGDADPEDAWDPDDPTDDLLDNLRRRCVLLVEHLEAARTSHLLEAAVTIRVRLLGEDINHVRARLEAEH